MITFTYFFFLAKILWWDFYDYFNIILLYIFQLSIMCKIYRICGRHLNLIYFIENQRSKINCMSHFLSVYLSMFPPRHSDVNWALTYGNPSVHFRRTRATVCSFFGVRVFCVHTSSHPKQISRIRLQPVSTKKKCFYRNFCCSHCFLFLHCRNDCSKCKC